ncbi:hypothetical protein E0Z10_g3192 [Xylaria hypoxylon]|uniref:Xylanolytic transcriptional activator regulatory domain-containing protein n=1 Tax=Xylaria hypoxylon TaxID=37992 RepID=A0A4Z0Z209_9PEZI|nr:hypothetical protein E0Z10_g3192 [Xylaria hypoxylon]
MRFEDSNGCDVTSARSVDERESVAIGEDLQARLKDQRGRAMAIDKDSNSHQGSITDNDDYSSEEGNEAREMSSIYAAEASHNICDVQCWPGQITQQQPIVSIAPLDGIENIESDLLFTESNPQQSQVNISFGIELSLTSIVCTDLNQLYFDRVHTFAPILQKSRYLSWSKQPGKTKQKLCLQYTMWILAASFSSQFQVLRSNLYNEARHLLDTLDTDTEINQGYNHSIHIEQVQAWVLMAMYELTSDASNYQRGLVDVGRAFRLIQVMKLHEIDGYSQVSSSPHDDHDWVDKESIRRTFWLAYTMDRFTSAIDGVPLTLNEQQIHTRLPSPEAEFASGKPIKMCFLFEAVNAVENSQLRGNTSPFMQSVIVATICGRVLEHKQRPPTTHSQHQDPSSMDPNRDISHDTEQLDPILVFVTLAAYMAILVLCETVEPMNFGIEAQSTQMTDALLFEQNQRALDAAHELAMLTTRLGHIDHFQTHPFTPIPLLSIAKFCLSRAGQSDSYTTVASGIISVLQELAHVNGLAQNCLQLLGHKLGNCLGMNKN